MGAHPYWESTGLCHGKAAPPAPSHFRPWQLLKTPPFRPVQLAKILTLKNIYVSLSFLAPKPLFYVWASSESPSFPVSKGPLLKPPIFKPSVAHIYHFHIRVPHPTTGEMCKTFLFKESPFIQTLVACTMLTTKTCPVTPGETVQ